MTSLPAAAATGSGIVVEHLRIHYPELRHAVDRSTGTQVVLDLPATAGSLDRRVEVLVDIARAHAGCGYATDADRQHQYRVWWTAASGVQVTVTTPPGLG